MVDIAIKNNQALVALRINEGVKIDDQAIAAIKTSGIIGDKYVSIQHGPGDHDLADGGLIKETQSAFVLEDEIAQLINNSGSSGSSNSGNNSNSNCNCSDTSAAKKPGKSDK